MTGWFVIVLKYLRPTSHSPGSIVTRSPVIGCDPGPLKVEMSVYVELFVEFSSLQERSAFMQMQTFSGFRNTETY